MTLPETIDVLTSNRLLKTREQVAAFEEALEQVSSHPLAAEHLREIHLVLDDQTHHNEVMYGVIHLLESFAIEKQIQAFIEALPTLQKQAPEWVKTLNYRLLNDETARSVYKEAFRNAVPATKGLIRSAVAEIIEAEQPPLRDHARHMLTDP